MEQEGEDRGGGGGEEKNKQLLPPQPPPPQPQQNQKCPRCDSVNTKFCYYNNYSLSQPRYYCKGCKRYWTQGGTLRNIPVGGASRKGNKRPKTSSSPSSSSTQKAPFRSSQPQPPPLAQSQSNLTTLMGPPGVPSTSPYNYHATATDVYLSSLPPLHSLNTAASQPFNHPPNYADSGNMIPGFGAAAPFAPSSFYDQIGPEAAAEQGLIIPSSMMGTANSHLDHRGSRRFVNINSNHQHRVSDDDGSLWSTISTTTSIGGNNSDQSNTIRGASSSSSLIPNHYNMPHLPGYDAPPQ